MLTSEQLDAINREANRKYDLHVSQLLKAGNHIKNYKPQSRTSIKNLYEIFLEDTHTAISDFGDILVKNITRVVTKIVPTI